MVLHKLPEDTEFSENEEIVLSNDEITQSQSAFRDFLDDLLNKPENYKELLEGIQWDSANGLLQLASLKDHDKQDLEAGLYSRRLSEFTKVFFDELIAIIKTQRNKKNPDEQAKLKIFMQNLYQSFFSMSPNIFNYLNLENQLLIIAQGTRLAEIQGFLGANLIGEYVYNLSFSNTDLSEKIYKDLQSKPIPELIDLLHVCQIISANALGSGDWALPAYNQIVKVVKKILKANSSQYIQYAASISLERMNQEEQDPSLSVFKYTGDVGEGRLAEPLNEFEYDENFNLLNQIEPDTKIPRSSAMLRVSSDAVAIFDHSGIPQKYGLYKSNKQKPSSGINKKKLDDAIHLLEESNDQIEPDKINEILLYFNQEIFGNDYESWSKMCNQINQEEFQKHFSVLLEISNIVDQFNSKQNELTQKGEDKCRQVSIDFVNGVLVKGGELAKELSNKQLNDIVKKIGEFADTNQLESAFSEASKFVSLLKIIIETRRKALLEYSDFFDNLISPDLAHTEIWNSIYAELGQYKSDCLKEINIKYEEILETQDKISKLFPELKNNLLLYLQDLRSKKKLSKVHFVDYEQMVHSLTLNPFPQDTDTDLPLLIKHLHNPPMRRLIEQDLEIDLQKLTLQSQIHLLRFLENKDRTTFNRLREILKNKKQSSNEILASFLATAGDTEFGEVLFELANAQNTDKIFKCYAETVAKARELTDIIIEDHGYLQEKDVFNALLLRAKNLLIETNDSLKKEKAIDSDELVNDFEKKMNAVIEVLSQIKETQDRLEFPEEITIESLRKSLDAGLKSYINEVLTTYDTESPLIEKGFSEKIFDSMDIKEDLSAWSEVYFPVGISRELPNFEKVLNGELNATKPVDVISYLFWLANQGKPVDLVICDEIQKTNYELLYPEFLQDKPKDYATKTAIQIGDYDAKFYQTIIDTFGLKNIRVRRFERLTANDKFKKYQSLCRKLADNPLFKQAFDNLGQEQLQENIGEDNEKQKKLREYALTEVAFILANDSLKISHPNEAKIGYDPLAFIIKSIELEGKRLGIEDIFDNEKALFKILNKVLQKTEQYLSTQIDKSQHGMQKSYLFNFKRFIFGEKKGKESTNGAFGNQGRYLKPAHLDIGKTKNISLAFNFYCPLGTNSQSFGVDETKDQASLISFKEPYSTYFYKSSSLETLTLSDQIPILPDHDLFVGLLSKLNSKKQKIYLNEVLIPLLRQFFAVLEQTSKDYFIGINKNQEELKSEIKDAKTIIDVIDFIRKYIIIPFKASEGPLLSVKKDENESIAA